MAIESNTSSSNISFPSSSNVSLSSDSDSFLYLHPSENPTTALVSPVLDSTNYHSWCKSMITTLSAKNKAQFVDGLVEEHTKTDPSHNAWKSCNNMVVSWIIHSISPHIRQSILWMDRAQDIWNDLRSRFFQGDLLRIFELQMETTSLKQGDSTVNEFFTKLRVSWDELESFRPDLACSCEVKCSCQVSLIISQRKTEDRAMQFFRGLNEQYANIKSHVLLMGHIPPMFKIFSYVVQQERQFVGHNFFNHSKSNVIVAINIVNCSYCGNSGHTDNVCFKKNGFPSKNSGNRKVCIYCGKNGHTVEICYKKHGFPLDIKCIMGRARVLKPRMMALIKKCV